MMALLFSSNMRLPLLRFALIAEDLAQLWRQSRPGRRTGHTRRRGSHRGRSGRSPAWTRGGKGRGAVGQDLKQWWLVRHQRPHLLWMPFHQRQRIHCPAAAGEQVYWAGIEGLDEPAQVVRVPRRRRRAGRIGFRAALRAARVAVTTVLSVK